MMPVFHSSFEKMYSDYTYIQLIYNTVINACKSITVKFEVDNKEAKLTPIKNYMWF